VAWEPLGWKAAWYSQFDPEHNYKSGPDFASAVLAHHYPDVPNLGDMKRIHDNETFKKEEIDILVGGTPCQSFSLSGFRKGLRDKRGRLALTFCEIARDKRPRWVLWENVADVLSSGGGRDFGSILGALADCGYGLAYRVLDAQFFGVPQRRRRVFVVGHLGDTGANRAEEVLFEREGGFWDAAEGGALVRGEPSLAVEASGGPAVYLHIESSTERSLCLLASGTGRNINAETFVIHNLPERGEFDASLVDVRKLTPLEWERLQGFPDGHTLVPWRGKPAELCPDTPRYSALGNSIATPLLRWIGERIAAIDGLSSAEVAQPLGPENVVVQQPDPEAVAKGLSDSELVERCVRGFRDLREAVPYLREAHDRFSQPGRRVPVPGNPTWTEWVQANLHVTVRRVQQLLSEGPEPRETISRGSKRRPRKLGSGDWRGLLKATERRNAHVFGSVEDPKQLAGAIRNYAQGIADQYARPGGKLVVSVSVEPRK